MTYFKIIAMFLLLTPAYLHAGQLPQRYAIATSPTPVLNTPGFRKVFGGSNGNSLKTDNCGQIRELEFIALTGTSFVIQKEITSGDSKVYRVTTSDYPYSGPNGLFIDSRFVSISEAPPIPRQKKQPEKDEIIRRLRNAEGVGYVWGGNVTKGIPALTDLYPPKHLTKEQNDRWQLAGLDCSGLLYEATGGWTPRNTSELVRFGKQVDIEGLSVESIAAKLRPLDLIVWPGHILIALERGEVIESRLNCDGGRSGVIIRPAKERLYEIMRTRRPSNSAEPIGEAYKKIFVVRRWDSN
jgi:hypothetical protein